MVSIDNVQPYKKNVVDDNKDEVRWYVMNCHYRSEPNVCETLTDNGLEFFQAQLVVLKKHNGHKKKVLRSAIPGIFFVHASYNDLKPLTQPECHVRLNFKLNICELKEEKYMVVPDREMRNFMIVARAYDENPQYIPVNEPGLSEKLHKGIHVRIIGGSFDGYDGMFVQLHRGQRRQLIVVLNGITAITAQIDPDFVEVVEEAPV